MARYLILAEIHNGLTDCNRKFPQSTSGHPKDSDDMRYTPVSSIAVGASGEFRAPIGQSDRRGGRLAGREDNAVAVRSGSRQTAAAVGSKQFSLGDHRHAACLLPTATANCC